jgi:hypothetical protein
MQGEDLFKGFPADDAEAIIRIEALCILATLDSLNTHSIIRWAAIVFSKEATGGPRWMR